MKMQKIGTHIHSLVQEDFKNIDRCSNSLKDFEFDFIKNYLMIFGVKNSFERKDIGVADDDTLDTGDPFSRPTG